MNDDLHERIDQLEREKRWWKRVASAALPVLVVVLLLAGAICLYQERQARLAQLRAAQAAAEVRAKRDAAERVMQKQAEALRRAEEKKP
jgi:predicted negative regulator of RcsB-dependent stress response